MTRILSLIFFLSGATGLIYESVWSHYIKLILGHAAYAQTLVLAIFMGGMAIGAWLVSRCSLKIKNLLLGYAIVELAIGVLGLIFHSVFGLAAQMLFDVLLPVTSGGTTASLAKWGVATILILPQSILLGCTFPLMSGGVARLGKMTTGSTIALLYFSNSIGAVFGVLTAGFYLIGKVGLPGALMTAGIINVLIAIVVYRLAKDRSQEPRMEAEVNRAMVAGNKAGYWLLLASAITGGASFFYEIAWIRMLSMVLGSSTHSFELMLAAFILGLALGGLWIKKRIDSLEHPITFLGWVQIAMAVFALLTLPLYNLTFDITSYFMSGLGRTETGYTLFALFSHALALLVMLPATFCAGMTLPLLTLILWRKGAGEKAIGQVYAVNTLGSIAGVLLAVHVFIPTVGLKGLMLSGAALDGMLGIALLGMVTWNAIPLTAALTVAIPWMITAFWAQFDPLRMGAGVYRTATVSLDSAKVIRWEDGKTASIGIFAFDGKYVSVTTNGKPDATVNVVDYAKPTADEITMTMAAFVPMLYKPDAKVVANIGFGSGMTTHTLLAFPGIERLDTIEIEAAIIRGAKQGLEKRLPRAFHDERSHVHIDDARSFFSTRGQKYDIIVSEPSNPWVSGVASLFTEEFYRHTVRYLNEDGLFVQWLQLYETDISVVASVTASLNRVFDDYVIYATDNSNILIVARHRGKLPKPHPEVLDTGLVKEEMKRQRLTGYGNIEARRIAGKNLWSSLMVERRIPANSDFFPYVDLNAAQFRFMRANAASLTMLGESSVPVLEMIEARSALSQNVPLDKDKFFRRPGLIEKARALARHIVGKSSVTDIQEISAADLGALTLLRQNRHECADLSEAQLQALYQLAAALVPYLPATELRPVWLSLQKSAVCIQKDEAARQFFDVIQAVGERDDMAIIKTVDEIWRRKSFQPKGDVLEYLLLAELVAQVKSGDKESFRKFGESRLMTSGLKIQKPETESLFAMLGATMRAKESLKQ